MERRRDPSELENDEIHRRVATRIRQDPRVVEIARERVARWLERDGAEPHPATAEWQVALDMLPVEELAEFLESPTPRARRMRSSSPFFGLDR